MALLKYMARKGMTQQELADMLKVNQGTVSRWCSRGVPPQHLKRVSRITGLSVQKLRPDLFGA